MIEVNLIWLNQVLLKKTMEIDWRTAVKDVAHFLNSAQRESLYED